MVTSEVKSERTVQPGSVAGAGAGSGEKRRKQIGEALLRAEQRWDLAFG